MNWSTFSAAKKIILYYVNSWLVLVVEIVCWKIIVQFYNDKTIFRQLYPYQIYMYILLYLTHMIHLKPNFSCVCVGAY